MALELSTRPTRQNVLSRINRTIATADNGRDLAHHWPSKPAGVNELVAQAFNAIGALARLALEATKRRNDNPQMFVSITSALMEFAANIDQATARLEKGEKP